MGPGFFLSFVCLFVFSEQTKKTDKRQQLAVTQCNACRSGLRIMPGQTPLQGEAGESMMSRQ